MSNPEDKVAKSNGLTGDPLQRLASFKPPRDLSLGGVKPNKKIFTPNLNVTRNKNKGHGGVTSANHKKDIKNKKDEKNYKNRNMKLGPNIIKSGGVFSEGLGVNQKHSSRTFYGKDGDSTTNSIPRPTIRVKDMVKIDRELEEQKIKLASGYDKYGDECNICEDFKTALELDAPIKLPMDNGGWFFGQAKAAATVKQEVLVKTEPDDEPDFLLDRKPLAKVKKEVLEDLDAFNLLRVDRPTMMLLQLPDSLPGRGSSADDDGRRGKSEPAASGQENHDEKKEEEKCVLPNLAEGRIGKLRLHRSGRVMLCLGDMSLEVCAGTKSACHQEVVSVAADTNTRSARIISLGPLLHKLTVVPDWDTMFANNL